MGNYSDVEHTLGLLSGLKELARFAKFCRVGVLRVEVNTGVLYLFPNLGLHYLLSGIVAMEISFLSSSFLNRALTFRNEAPSSGVFKSLTKDHRARSLGIARASRGRYHGSFSPTVEGIIRSLVRSPRLHLFSGTSNIGDGRIDLDCPQATGNMDVRDFIRGDVRRWDWCVLDPPWGLQKYPIVSFIFQVLSKHLRVMDSVASAT